MRKVGECIQSECSKEKYEKISWHMGEAVKLANDKRYAESIYHAGHFFSETNYQSGPGNNLPRVDEGNVDSFVKTVKSVKKAADLRSHTLLEKSGKKLAEFDITGGKKPEY